LCSTILTRKLWPSHAPPAVTLCTDARGEVILCCDTSGNVQNVLFIHETEKCRYAQYDGYDEYDIPEEPQKVRYASERFVGDNRMSQNCQIMVKEAYR